MQRYGATARGDWQRPDPRQRALVLGFTLLVEVLVVLLIIAFGGSRVREVIMSSAPTAITFVPNEIARAPSPQPRRSEAKSAPRPTPPRPRPVPLAPPTPSAALPFIPMSRADLAASDISRLGSAAGAGAAPAAGAKTAAVGEGPGGVTLYAAEWVREPSDAELRTYLPRSVGPGSWALIACQTIAHNHVENCAQLGESPRGSGLSKAMRLAAWQFRVRPPRVDGKPHGRGVGPDPHRFRRERRSALAAVTRAPCGRRCRHPLDGGTNGAAGDRFIVNGDNTVEAYVVYARAEAIAAGHTGLNATTEIVVTRNNVVIGELDNVEEITINTGLGADSVAAVGDFGPTSLFFNTITVNGQGGRDTIDSSQLTSAHKLVLAGSSTTMTGLSNAVDGLGFAGQGMMMRKVRYEVDDYAILGAGPDVQGGYASGGKSNPMFDRAPAFDDGAYAIGQAPAIENSALHSIAADYLII